MRLLALAAVAAVVVAAAPAHAAWELRNFPEYGFAIDFPSEPKQSTGEYRGVVAGRVPTTIYSAQLDDVTYSVTIADFRNRPLDTPGILIEAAFIATQGGEVLADTVARTDNGQQFAKYGRRVAMMTKEGGKTVTEFYLVNGRLLMFEAAIDPKGDIGNPEIGRFQDSLRFNVDRDWTIPPPLPANREDGPRILTPIRPGQAAK
jgi:hypothetical protein